MFKSALLAGACAVALASAAQAMVVTSFSGGTLLPMPEVNLFGAGPEVFGDVTFSSTNAGNQGGAVFGYTGGYGFGSNGFWGDTIGPMAGVNASFDNFGVVDSMTFTFGTAVNAVGGFINYLPGGSTPTTLAIFDVNDVLIEETTLSFLTDGSDDSGQFIGFISATPIKSFTLTDNYVSLVNLRVDFEANAVPAPAALALFGLGLLGLAGLRARRA
jgi:hypothetical protein